MTCIVGVVHGERVYIGGDSAGVAGYALTVRADEKVFRNGPFLMGFTTSFRMGQLLRFNLKPPEHRKGVEPYEYMVTDFVDAARKCLKKGGYAKKENEVESGGDFLVGYRGHLFTVESDYQVAEATDGFNAVGCGAALARGALYITAQKKPRERVLLALKAAEHMNAGVRGPFIVEAVR